ncbi:hypothetical protein JCM1840_006819 [Sporobolomyces johnsonii]
MASSIAAASSHPLSSPSRLMSLPLELINKTCEHIDPASLLALSETCTAFNRHLVSKRQRSVWQTSFARAGLPALSDHEFSFACLMFKDGCERCHQTNPLVDGKEFYIRRRWCQGCCEFERVSERFLVDRRRINSLELEATKFVSHKNFYWPADRSQMRRSYPRHELITVNVDIDDILLQHLDLDATLCATIEYGQRRLAAVAHGDRDAQLCFEWWVVEHRRCERASYAAYRSRCREVVKCLARKNVTINPSLTSAPVGSPLGDALRRDHPLTDAEFAAITPLVLVRALEWAEAEQRKADAKAHTPWLARVRKIYVTMPVSVPGTALAVPWAVFITLPAVKGALDLDQIRMDPALGRQVRQAVRLVKLGFARELVAAHAYAKQPFPSALVQSITPAGYTPQADSMQWFGPRIARGDAGLDFADPATIADADLDQFVNRWTSRFRFAPMLTGGARALFEERDPDSWSRFSSAHSIGLAPCVLRLQLKVLKILQLDAELCTDADVDASHLWFVCDTCGSAWSQGRTWTQIAHHIDDDHDGFCTGVRFAF